MTQPTNFTDPEQTFTVRLPAGVTLTLDTTEAPHAYYHYWSGEKSFFSIYSQPPPGQTAQEFLALLQEDENEVTVQVNRPVTENGRCFHLLQVQTRSRVERSHHYRDGQLVDVPAHTRAETVCYQFWPGRTRDVSVGYSHQDGVAVAELEMLQQMLASFQLIEQS